LPGRSPLGERLVALFCTLLGIESVLRFLSFFLSFFFTLFRFNLIFFLFAPQLSSRPTLCC
jgi:hypothetical protein